MKKDNQKLSKEKLLAEIGRLKKELKKKKKYGLIWEDKPEDVVEMCKEKLPVLKEVKNKEIITDKNKPINLLIEGDNYHALSVLNYTHKGKIDVIYIDPPYNRGGDFKYNDDYVDREDPYRHSKWLSFMEKRLLLAKNLLKKTGVIFISIDDNEVSQLRLLLDNNIFSELSSIGPIIWQKASGGGNAKQIVIGHEFVLCYGNKDIIFTQKNYKHDNKKFEKSKKYISKKGEWYFINDDVVRKYFGKYPKGVERRCEYEDLLKYKGKEQKKEIDEKIKTGEFILVPNPKNSKKHFICALEKLGGLRMVLYSIIQGIFNAEGKEDLVADGLSENAFDYPKPVRLIKLLLDSVGNKDALVLDFFAGSGTTAKAVLALNSEDNGNRKLILCTNNEGNICTEVCYPRVKNIINGHKIGKESIPSLGGNFKYFKTDFVNFKESNDKNKIRMTEEAIEMLCVKEGTFEEVENRVGFKIFKNHDHHTGIIFDQLVIKEFKKAISNIKGKFSVYIFSLGDDSFDEEFEDIKQKIKLSPIPEAILKVYRRIFK